MTRAVSIAAFALLVASLACSSVRTHYDYDPNADFERWRTYAWYEAESYPAGSPRLDNPLLHGRIVNAIDRALTAHGFTQAEDDATPDFYVDYHLSMDRRLDVRTVNRMYHGGSARRSWGARGWGGVAWTETRVSEVEEGTMLIDLVDVEARQLVWRGNGTRRLPRNLQGDRLTRTVDEAVNEILRQFPPDR